MIKRSTLLSVATFVSVAIVVQLVWGWDTLLSSWQAIPMGHLAAFISLYWFTYLLRAYRIRIYFAKSNLTLSLSGLCSLVVKQTFWANLLPAKTGEVSFPLLMKRKFSVAYTDSVPALIVLRLFDAYVLGSIAASLALWLWSPWLVLIWLPVAFVLPFISIKLYRFMVGILYRYRSHKYARLGWKLLRNIPQSPVTLMQMNLLSWANWAVKVVLFAGILASMTFLSIDQTLLASLIGEVSGMLPGLPAGFGNYEAAVSVGLMPYMDGASTSDMVAAAVNAHLFILFNSVFGAMVAYSMPSKPSHG